MAQVEHPPALPQELYSRTKSRLKNMRKSLKNIIRSREDANFMRGIQFNSK